MPRQPAASTSRGAVTGTLPGRRQARKEDTMTTNIERQKLGKEQAFPGMTRRQARNMRIKAHKHGPNDTHKCARCGEMVTRRASFATLNPDNGKPGGRVCKTHHKS